MPFAQKRPHADATVLCLDPTPCPTVINPFPSVLPLPSPLFLSLDSGPSSPSLLICFFKPTDSLKSALNALCLCFLPCSTQNYITVSLLHHHNKPPQFSRLFPTFPLVHSLSYLPLLLSPKSQIYRLPQIRFKEGLGTCQ